MATIAEALTIAMRHLQAGELRAAEQIYSQVLAADPNQIEALHLRGVTASQLGRHEEAVELISRAIALAGNVAAFHINLGAIFRAQGKLSEAVACCSRAIDLQPTNVKAHNNLGAALIDQGQLDDAVACFRRALELSPEYVEAHSNLGTVFRDQARHAEAIACFRRALELRPDHFAAHRNLLFTLWFCPNVDSAAIFEEHCRWNRQWAEPLARQIAAHSNDPTPDRRLRIGYVSPNFYDHCQAFFTAPLFTAHDRHQFEIMCYSDVTSPDSFTDRLRSRVDKWMDVGGFTDEGVARLVREDQVDILVDLTMHMQCGRPLLFARKPAPVQVCWLAYPGTTGLQAIDYRLTDAHLDPPRLNDRYYSEESVRLLDSFWCYDPLTDVPAVNSLPAQSNGYVTFCCLNNFCKTNAAVLKLWARVLGMVERSRLLLLAPEGSARQNVLQILEPAGISPDRITFVARQPRLSYLELYNQIDIGLDTFPYNGHTTSLDSFWMGVPVVTLVGSTAVGRAGLCQLHNLGLPELVAHTPEQFVEVAAGLANDLPRLTHIRANLRARMEQSPLMDAPRFARSIESQYRNMWHSWCATRPPLAEQPRC